MSLLSLLTLPAILAPVTAGSPTQFPSGAGGGGGELFLPSLISLIQQRSYNTSKLAVFLLSRILHL